MALHRTYGVRSYVCEGGSPMGMGKSHCGDERNRGEMGGAPWAREGAWE